MTYQWDEGFRETTVGAVLYWLREHTDVAPSSVAIYEWPNTLELRISKIDDSGVVVTPGGRFLEKRHRIYLKKE